MYKLTLISFLCCLTLFSSGQNTWVQRASFSGNPRTASFYFSAGGLGFIGCGLDSTQRLVNDCWKYNLQNDNWSPIADFPGAPRRGAVAFGINGKGYAGTGLTDTSMLKDFWSYNLVTNSWSQEQDLGQYRTNFTAVPRRDASAVVWLNTAYIVCGYDGSSAYLKQLLRFDPLADTSWSNAKNFTNVTDQTLFGRRWGAAFSLDNIIYYGTGYSSSNDYKKDFWSYDPIRDLWSQVADLPGNARSNAISFTAYSKAYIGSGTNHYVTPDFYRYDGTLNTWTYVADYPLRAVNQISFSIGNRAFVGLGNDSLGKPLNDFYEFIPDSTVNIHELNSIPIARVYPTLIATNFTVELLEAKKNTATMKLYDLKGNFIEQFQLTNQKTFLEKKENYSGLYFYTLSIEGKQLQSGKLIFTE